MPLASATSQIVASSGHKTPLSKHDPSGLPKKNAGVFFKWCPKIQRSVMMHVPSFPYQTNYFGPIGYSFPIFNIHSPAASPNSMACGSGPDPADPVCVQTWPLPVQLGEKAWPVQCRNELRHPGRRTSHAPSAACGSAYVGRAHSVYVRPGSVPWDSKTPKQFARKNRREEMKRIHVLHPGGKKPLESVTSLRKFQASPKRTISPANHLEMQPSFPVDLERPFGVRAISLLTTRENHKNRATAQTSADAI